MKRVFGALLVLCGMIWVSGCTYTGAVRSSIAPMSTVGKTYNGNVSLVIDPAVNNAEVSTNVGAHTVKVAAGSALSSAITESARLVFPKVSPQETETSGVKGDITVHVRLSHISGNASFNPGFWSPTANITTQISIVVEMVRKDGSILYRQVVTGTGLQSQSDTSPDDIRKGMEIGLERAIQQIADQTTTVFVTGLNQFN